MQEEQIAGATRLVYLELKYLTSSPAITERPRLQSRLFMVMFILGSLDFLLVLTELFSLDVMAENKS